MNKLIMDTYETLLETTIKRFKELGIEDDGGLFNPVRIAKQSLLNKLNKEISKTYEN